MFRIRQVPDDVSPSNAAAVRQVQDIISAQFPALSGSDQKKLQSGLRDPISAQFRPLLFVAEDSRERVRGFAWALHAPDLHFVYLDFIATAPGITGGGIGGALYERVRDVSAALGASGIFLECLPDDAALSPDPVIRRQNAARLKFYENYGARPIINTAYETPVKAEDTDPPYLIFDPLGSESRPDKSHTRRIVRAILERKYKDLCPPDYVKQVVASFKDDPVELRPYRYQSAPHTVVPHAMAPVALVVTDQHDIHHVADKGYVEAPVRVRTIRRELEKTKLFEEVAPLHFPDTHVRAVHSGQFVDFLKAACANVEPKKSVYPYVFPIRNAARPPKDLPLRAGYYCIDTFTPLNDHAYRAARRAVDCALTAAGEVLGGRRLAYALVRPPGHHAERRAFGGFCYFNNAAIAAHYLSRYGRVAVFDIDYHHGNGTQDIFYERSDVLTVSIHGHPSFAYPYFSGFRKENGQGAGAGYNLNIPLPETITPNQYRDALDNALSRIMRFDPDFLVLAAGFDTASGDPTGSWPHRADDFQKIGEIIGATGLPIIVVQEGGYRTRTLGVNVRNFFNGLVRGAHTAPLHQPTSYTAPPSTSVKIRRIVRNDDAEKIRALVESTGVFSTAEVSIAQELILDRIQKGSESEYDFVIAERGDHLVGYACFGAISGTEAAYELYWIAVSPDTVGSGIGRRLMATIEGAIASKSSKMLYAETSSTDGYKAARAFYRKCGFKNIARLPDYYAAGDDNLFFAKAIPTMTKA